MVKKARGTKVKKARDFRKEYVKYYGKKPAISKKQRQHRRDKAARNLSRAKMIRQFGKGTLKGKQVCHKNGIPTDSSKNNLVVKSDCNHIRRKHKSLRIQ